jgi:general secretion pathway protein I
MSVIARPRRTVRPRIGVAPALAATTSAGVSAQPAPFRTAASRTATPHPHASQPPRMRRHARGYTLIEVIVAFALLALALTLLLGSLSNAARQVHWADGAGRATLHAQSLLDQVGVGEALQAGTRHGSFDNERYHWTLAIKPFVDPVTGKPAATADGAQLFQVDLAMEWGASAAQHMDVHTLRLSRSDTVQSIPGI